MTAGLRRPCLDCGALGPGHRVTPSSAVQMRPFGYGQANDLAVRRLLSLGLLASTQSGRFRLGVT